MPSTYNWSIKTEAPEVAKTLKDEIVGKNVFITGAAINGLGWAAADALADYANLIIISGSRLERLNASRDDILSRHPKANIRVIVLDLSSFEAIRKTAAEVNSYSEPIHVLINNAAGFLSEKYYTTKDGFEAAFGIDHLGHFLFANLIVPRLLAARTETYQPRVVAISSHAHNMSDVHFDNLNFSNGEGYSKWGAYGQAKAANVLFATEFAKRYAKEGILAFSVHPGTIETNAFDHIPKEERIAFGMLSPEGEPWDKFEFKTLPAGAAPHLVAAFDPSIKGDNGLMVWEDIKVGKENISPFCSNPENAAKLWELSNKLVGENFKA